MRPILPLVILTLALVSCGKATDVHQSSTSNQYASCSKPNRPNVDIDDYYKEAGNKTGDQLKSTLNRLIKDHQFYSYKCADTIIQESDQHPDSPNHVLGFYSQEKLNKKSGWNKEHVWAKSHGFPSKSAHAFSDVHHLRPTLNKNNSSRGNSDFEVGGDPLGDICPGCYRTDSTWEAPDSVKGDVARIMFYMATRYEGSDNSRTPDLELVKGSTRVGQAKFGDICTLLKWNELDPVSPEESRRNEVVYQWQGNRNPYIDFPEWIKKIWGDGGCKP